MARVLGDSQTVVRTWQPWLQVIAVGAGVGILQWLLTVLIGNYIVEPLACRDLTDATFCTNATPLAGTISTILVAVAGTIALVRLGVARPIILSVATGALLWDLSGWTEGLLWIEALAWSLWLYVMCYVLFAWIARYTRLWVVIVLSVLIVAIIRIALVL